MQPVVTSPPSKKKGKYDITFKLKVIQWAEKHSNRAAGSKFGLNESTIRGWRKSSVANSLEALSADFSRGVLSLHQPLHDDTHLNSHHHPATNGGNSLSVTLGGGADTGSGAGGRAKLHDALRSGRRPLSSASTHMSAMAGMSGAESGGESPPRSLNMDERELARLSCSPSDDGYYEDVSYYQEEVVDDEMADPHHSQQQLHHSHHQTYPHLNHHHAQQQQQQHPPPQQSHHSSGQQSLQRQQHQQEQKQQQQQQQQQQQRQQQQQQQPQPQQQQTSSPSPPPTPSPPPASPALPPAPVLKTISHQVTSKPFPEIQLPFTVIVCKSVRDHWLQRYASQLPARPVTEQDSFAKQLGLERR